MTGTLGTRRRRNAAAPLVLAILLGAAACQQSQDASPSPSEPPAVEATTIPEIAQAKWRFETKRTDRVGKLSTKQKRRFKAQRPRLKKVVREVYDALFLEPETMSQIVATRFRRGAGRALLQSRTGFRTGADQIKTVARKAKIGIEADTATSAAARVFVRARARGPSGVVRLRHAATMWLQREEGGWHVIGFEVNQERVR